jgi:hypothetical protein
MQYITASIVEFLAIYALIHIFTGLSLGPSPWEALLACIIETAFTCLVALLVSIYTHWRILIGIPFLAFLIIFAAGLQCTDHTTQLHYALHFLTIVMIAKMLVWLDSSLALYVLLVLIVVLLIKISTLVRDLSNRVQALNQAHRRPVRRVAQAA